MKTSPKNVKAWLATGRRRTLVVATGTASLECMALDREVIKLIAIPRREHDKSDPIEKQSGISTRLTSEENEELLSLASLDYRSA
jgi:hypothetical protein